MTLSILPPGRDPDPRQPDEPRCNGRLVVEIGTTTDGPLSGLEDVPGAVKAAVAVALIGCGVDCFEIETFTTDED